VLCCRKLKGNPGRIAKPAMHESALTASGMPTTPAPAKFCTKLSCNCQDVAFPAGSEEAASQRRPDETRKCGSHPAALWCGSPQQKKGPQIPQLLQQMQIAVPQEQQGALCPAFPAVGLPCKRSLAHDSRPSKGGTEHARTVGESHAYGAVGNKNASSQLVISGLERMAREWPHVRVEVSPAVASCIVQVLSMRAAQAEGRSCNSMDLDTHAAYGDVGSKVESTHLCSAAMAILEKHSEEFEISSAQMQSLDGQAGQELSVQGVGAGPSPPRTTTKEGAIVADIPVTLANDGAGGALHLATAIATRVPDSSLLEAKVPIKDCIFVQDQHKNRCVRALVHHRHDEGEALPALLSKHQVQMLAWPERHGRIVGKQPLKVKRCQRRCCFALVSCL
jgi:hypothetical protein